VNGCGYLRVKFFGVFAWLIEGSRPQYIGKKKILKKNVRMFGMKKIKK
jgi:hypothetical protein